MNPDICARLAMGWPRPTTGARRAPGRALARPWLALWIAVLAAPWSTEVAAASTPPAPSSHFPSPAGVGGLAPADYLEQRQIALDLFASGKWPQAEAVLKRLTAAYPYDGELWRDLGLIRYVRHDYADAASAFQQAQDAGLRFDAHDNAANLARCFGHLGDGDRAARWLEVALFVTRYREPQKLLADQAFDAVRATPAFKRVAEKLSAPVVADRVAGLRADVDLYVRLIRAYRTDLSPQEIARVEAAADQLKARLAKLPDDDVGVEFQRLAAAAPGGHNISPSLVEGKGVGEKPFLGLPVDLYLFPEGLFIVGAAAPEYQSLIGARVLAFGGIPTQKIEQRVGRLIDRDRNDESRLVALEPFFLSSLPVLHDIGASPSSDQATLVVQQGDDLRPVVLRGTAFRGRRQLFMDPIAGRDPPLAFRHADQSLWFEDLAPNSVYVQFNGVEANANGESIAAFARRLANRVADPRVKSLIVDARFNLGGDTFTYVELLRALVAFDSVPGHRIFYIEGRDTFSAAMNFSVDVARLTHAVIVGEPAGAPRATGDPVFFTLPNSRLQVRISTNVWSLFSPDDARSWLPPSLPVALTAEDYFAGRDTILETIRAMLGAPPESGADRAAGDRRPVHDLATPANQSAARLRQPDNLGD